MDPFAALHPHTPAAAQPAAANTEPKAKPRLKPSQIYANYGKPVK
jgi:hypothetical protein